jgi:AcrR family transcriptional regulator
MNISGPFALEARNLGKSARTRARLMDAAVAVFARDGFEAASVNEIARLADVANGTFYVHFKDKDAIAVDVTFRIANDFARQIDEAMSQIEDAAERFSCATRQFMELAAAQPRWGWALIRSAWYAPELHRQMESFMRADLDRGVKQGLFTRTIDPFIIDTILSMIFSALAARLRGDVGEEAASRVSELVLCMLGYPSAQAHAVAWSPIVLKGFSTQVLPRDPKPRRAATLVI